MKTASYTVTSEWMREAFRAVDRAVKKDATALPPKYHNLIHNPPTEIKKLQEWIAEICTLCKVRPSQLANVANLSPSTLNRFLKPENTSASLNAKTISLIEEAATTLAISYLDNNITDWHDTEGDGLESPVGGVQLKFKHDLMRIPVLGTLGINQEWMFDTFQNSFDEEYAVVVPSSLNYRNRYLFAFELLDMRDDRVDSFEKELLICLPTWFDGLNLKGHERVIIIERPQSQTISAGIRDLSRDERGNIWLMPLHRDVGNIEPSFYGRETVQTVRGQTGIAFLVVGSYRRFAWGEDPN